MVLTCLSPERLYFKERPVRESAEVFQAWDPDTGSLQGGRPDMEGLEASTVGRRPPLG